MDNLVALRSLDWDHKSIACEHVFYEKLVFLLKRFENCLQSQNIPFATPIANDPTWFASFSLEKRKYILKNIDFAVEIYESAEHLTHRQGLKTKPTFNEIELLKNSLKMLNLNVVDEDIFHKISEDDIIEIFDAEGSQIYRSYNFFKFCGYSIVDLISNSWDTLWTRPTIILNKLLEIAPTLYSNKTKIYEWQLPSYLVHEKYGGCKKKLVITHKFACPLTTDGSSNITACLTTANIKIISDPTDLNKLVVF